MRVALQNALQTLPDCVVDMHGHRTELPVMAGEHRFQCCLVGIGQPSFPAVLRAADAVLKRYLNLSGTKCFNPACCSKFRRCTVFSRQRICW